MGVKIEARAEELTAENAKEFLRGLVIDAFDNGTSRQAVKDACLQIKLDCLHVGLADGYAEIIWNEQYRVPSSAQDDICDYPLARNLVLLTVAVACETLATYIVAKTTL